MVTVLIVIVSLRPSHRHHYHSSVDLAKVRNATPQPDAAREDAIVISITREGKVYCRTDMVPPERIPDCIRGFVARGSRPSIFIKADAHSRWGTTEEVIAVLSQVQTRSVVFLVQRRRPLLAGR